MLKIFLKQLKQSESIKDTFGIFQAYRCLGELNLREGNYRDAIKYSKIGLKYFQNKKDSWWQGNYSNMASCLAKSYEELNILDSALYYAQIGRQVDLTYFGRNSNIFWGNIFGAIYSKLGATGTSSRIFQTILQLYKKLP